MKSFPLRDRGAIHSSGIEIERPYARLVLASAICLATLIATSSAVSQGTSEYEVRNQQEWLIWTTDYEGLIDGKTGPETLKGIKKFQARLRHPETGRLTADEERALEELGRKKKERAGFEEVTDPKAGVRVGIPFGLVSDRAGKETKWGRQWYGKEAGLAIDTLRVRDVSLRQLYDRLISINNRKIAYERFVDNNWFVIAAFENDFPIYVKARLVNQAGQAPEIRGFSIWMNKQRPRDYEALAPAMLSSFTTNTNTAEGGPLVGSRPQTSSSSSMPDLRRNPPPIAVNKPAEKLGPCLNGLGDCPTALSFRPSR